MRAALSLLRMSSSLPYGRLRPSDDVTTTRLYWAGFIHSIADLKQVRIINRNTIYAKIADDKDVSNVKAILSNQNPNHFICMGES